MFASPPKPKKAAPVAPVVVEKKPVQKSQGFNFFGSPPKKEPTPEPVEIKPAPKKAPAFSFFGGASPKKAAPKAAAPVKLAAPKKAVAKKAVAKKAVPKKAVVKKTAPKKAVAKKAAPIKDTIPVVSKFSQGADGSITGIVSNSKNFRAGTKITTSPVKRGAKSGDVVTTSSGSKYRLG